ncbi:MAG: ABC transporter substrate-binding protein, partial [Bellilinea sp.]
MKMRLTVLSFLVVVSMVLTACVQQVTPTPEPTAVPTAVPATEVPTDVAPTEEPKVELGPVLKIGQIGMMSGAMALYGLQQQRGFELGLEYASGGQKDDAGHWIIANRPVEVLVRDDEGNPEKAVQLARELIEKDGVELLQGPVSSASAAALTTVALENKIILMVDPAASFLITGQYFNPYVFRTSRTSFD